MALSKNQIFNQENQTSHTKIEFFVIFVSKLATKNSFTPGGIMNFGKKNYFLIIS